MVRVTAVAIQKWKDDERIGGWARAWQVDDEVEKNVDAQNLIFEIQILFKIIEEKWVTKKY